MCSSALMELHSLGGERVRLAWPKVECLSQRVWEKFIGRMSEVCHLQVSECIATWVSRNNKSWVIHRYVKSERRSFLYYLESMLCFCSQMHVYEQKLKLAKRCPCNIIHYLAKLNVASYGCLPLSFLSWSSALCCIVILSISVYLPRSQLYPVTGDHRMHFGMPSCLAQCLTRGR